MITGGPLRQHPRLAICCLLGPAVLLAACGILKAPPPLPTATPSASIGITNASFEQTQAPWTATAGTAPNGFSISDAAAHSGARSARLTLAGGTTSEAAGVTQPVVNPKFPEFVSGFYRVDDWRPGDPAGLMYLQFSIVVRGGDFGDNLPQHELRVLIAGAPREPQPDPAVRYTFLDRGAPQSKRWVYFSYPVTEAFLFRFGKAPSRWDAIELRLEVRSDPPERGGTTGAASVYFDDLYVGDQRDNPNRPPDP
ncbi:MAG: hypothetical protein HYX50_02085 [Chloroflexi bacterium]|nr:hypothetical protein [Chloroflexota bacterium]